MPVGWCFMWQHRKQSHWDNYTTQNCCGSLSTRSFPVLPKVSDTIAFQQLHHGSVSITNKPSWSHACNAVRYIPFRQLHHQVMALFPCITNLSPCMWQHQLLSCFCFSGKQAVSNGAYVLLGSSVQVHSKPQVLAPSTKLCHNWLCYGRGSTYLCTSVFGNHPYGLQCHHPP